MPKAMYGLLVFAALILTAAACSEEMTARGAAVADTYGYAAGTVDREYRASLDRAYNASLTAVQGLGLVVTSKTKDLSGATIEAKDGERKVWVVLKFKRKDLTEVGVRVGLVEDKSSAARIHDAIARRL